MVFLCGRYCQTSTEYTRKDCQADKKAMIRLEMPKMISNQNVLVQHRLGNTICHIRFAWAVKGTYIQAFQRRPCLKSAATPLNIDKGLSRSRNVAPTNTCGPGSINLDPANLVSQSFQRDLRVRRHIGRSGPLSAPASVYQPWSMRTLSVLFHFCTLSG